jgi:hypothetical protein
MRFRRRIEASPPTAPKDERSMTNKRVKQTPHPFACRVPLCDSTDIGRLWTHQLVTWSVASNAHLRRRLGQGPARRLVAAGDAPQEQSIMPELQQHVVPVQTAEPLHHAIEHPNARANSRFHATRVRARRHLARRDLVRIVGHHNCPRFFPPSGEPAGRKTLALPAIDAACQPFVSVWVQETCRNRASLVLLFLEKRLAAQALRWTGLDQRRVRETVEPRYPLSNVTPRSTKPTLAGRSPKRRMK